ncbi:hypothetical protein MXD61_05195, partial [Frankia sp. AgPm24]|uniref:hypothetical protein n=1 Tax=Frankia sp. AgPm24 TaxID=631128 RepID=UPI0020100E25
PPAPPTPPPPAPGGGGGAPPPPHPPPLYGDAVLTGVDPTSVIPVYYDAPDLYRQLLTADLLQVHIQHTPTSTWIAHSEGHRSFLDAYQAVEELTGVPQVRLRVTPAQDIPPIR